MHKKSNQQTKDMTEDLKSIIEKRDKKEILYQKHKMLMANHPKMSMYIIDLRLSL